MQSKPIMIASNWWRAVQVRESIVPNQTPTALCCAILSAKYMDTVKRGGVARLPRKDLGRSSRWLVAVESNQRRCAVNDKCDVSQRQLQQPRN